MCYCPLSLTFTSFYHLHILLLGIPYFKIEHFYLVFLVQALCDFYLYKKFEGMVSK